MFPVKYLTRKGLSAGVNIKFKSESLDFEFGMDILYQCPITKYIQICIPGLTFDYCHGILVQTLMLQWNYMHYI